MKKVKKILLFTDILSSGGAQRQLVSLACILKERKYDVSVLDYWDNRFYDDFLSGHDIPFRHVPTKGKANIIRMFVSFVNTMHPDVVIAYLENPSIVSCIGRLFIRKKIRLIVSERNTSQRFGRQEKIRFLLFRLLADAVVVNSQSQYEFIATRCPGLLDKTSVITNVVDTGRFAPSARKPRNDTFRFVVAGRVVEQKNVLRFIGALGLLKRKGLEFIVDWYGEPYPQSYYEECLALRSRNGLEEYLVFHSPTKEIVHVYQNADAFVLPSIYEGFPNVLCEAMACGLPVIASNVCDNPRILGEPDCGYLVDPCSVESIAGAMERMMKLPVEERTLMGEKARARIVDMCSEDRFADLYVKTIEG